jgi:hypothetical protein
MRKTRQAHKELWKDIGRLLDELDPWDGSNDDKVVTKLKRVVQFLEKIKICQDCNNHPYGQYMCDGVYLPCLGCGKGTGACED